MALIKCVINSITTNFESLEGEMILLPGASGEVGVLFNHAPTIIELREGKVQIYKDHQIMQELDIKASIAYIGAKGVEIFCK